jgi:hypothetical protein
MRGERGQAGVETVVVLPVLFLLALLGLQALAWAASGVEASGAAAAAARAAARGDDPGAAARRAVPGLLRPGVRLEAGSGPERVSVVAPALLPGTPVLRVSDRVVGAVRH